MSEDGGELNDLRKEIAQLRAMFLLLITIGLLTLMCGNLVALFQLPRSEKIFTDMLGSPDKLPQLTRQVLDYGRFQGGQVAIIAVTALPVLTLLFLFVFRRSSVMVVFAGVVMVLLVAHWLILSTAIREPMQQIITGIAAG
jgi:hypothetical protein